MRNLILILLLQAVTFIGCTSIKFGLKPLEISPGDVLLPSGSNMHQNISASREILSPPFREVWEFQTDAGFPQYPMTASDGALFVSNLNGDLFAINIETGKKAGSISNSGCEYLSAPVLAGDNIYYSYNSLNGAGVVKYSINNGSEIWSRNLRKIRPPLIYFEDGIVTSDGSYIKKYNPSKGTLIWQAQSPVNSEMNNVILSGLFIFANDNAGTLYKIMPADGNIIQSIKLPEQITSELSIYDGKIYFTTRNQKLYCMDFDMNIIITKDIESYCTAGFTYSNDGIIFGCVNGNLYNINITSGAVNWKNSFGSAFTSSPLAHNELIFIGSMDKKFYCLNSQDGKILWNYETGGRIHSTPLIWGKYIFISSDDRNIYCFK